MKEYTPEELEHIKATVLKRLDRALEVNSFAQANTTPIWMNLLFILDKFNTAGYYGTISVKIQGTYCGDARETEVTHKLKENYEDPPKRS